MDANRFPRKTQYAHNFALTSVSEATPFSDLCSFCFSLQLIKIEDGMMEGDVMFHQFITKTPEEAKAIK
jgi:hypothetical protein